ncbi:hypothetical protein CPB85DRAFT_1342455 [Mucidula mucida]|nr:hypothetical protein CPB85DRAFT_1342455 [Mucidula mucida]
MMPASVPLTVLANSRLPCHFGQLYNWDRFIWSKYTACRCQYTRERIRSNVNVRSMFCQQNAHKADISLRAIFSAPRAKQLATQSVAVKRRVHSQGHVVMLILRSGH